MASSGGKSARVAAQRKFLDEASRRRRARKALESLEQDNFHDDPHADLVMSKKALNLFQDGGASSTAVAATTAGGEDQRGAAASTTTSSAAKSSKRKSRTAEYYKQRFRKNFAQLLEEDATNQESNGKGTAEDGKKDNRVANYITAQAPHSRKPQRHFCAVCGFVSAYSCIVCGVRYCSLPCQDTHRDTRCLKYTS